MLKMLKNSQKTPFCEKHPPKKKFFFSFFFSIFYLRNEKYNQIGGNYDRKCRKNDEYVKKHDFGPKKSQNEL